MAEKENNNRSLYIYTGLIFLVAVVLILIAFFGQSKIEKSQPVPVSQDVNTSITERASVLSEENRSLLEENFSMKRELESDREEIVDLKVQNELYKKQRDNSALLSQIADMCLSGEYEPARRLLPELDETMLSEDEVALLKTIKWVTEKDEQTAQ